MEKEDVNDYIVRGIYGEKEIKRDEKIQFLGTFRERVIIALTQSQVRSKQLYPEVEAMMKKYPQAQLLLNVEMGYEYISKYIALANRYKLPYTMVSDQQTDTEIGLVLAHPEAVDIESIFVKEDVTEEAEQAKSESKPGSFLRRLFSGK